MTAPPCWPVAPTIRISSTILDFVNDLIVTIVTNIIDAEDMIYVPEMLIVSLGLSNLISFLHGDFSETSSPRPTKDQQVLSQYCTATNTKSSQIPVKRGAPG